LGDVRKKKRQSALPLRYNAINIDQLILHCPPAAIPEPVPPQAHL
jgi:hypothetical protein